MKKLYLAKYWERILAWLVDFIIVMIIAGFVLGDWRFVELFSLNKYIIISIIFFAYWTISESIDGQSIGKRIMNLRVIGRDGEKISIKKAAIQSFGKAFILPIDIIIGLVARPDERLRAFNILSETTVIKIDEERSKVKLVKR